MHAAGNVIARDGAWRGRKGPGVFRIDTAFYGVARKNQFFLSNRKRQAFRNADLLTNQIDARDHIGARMFTLKPGIHFDEDAFAVFVTELDRYRKSVVLGREVT